MKHDSIFIKVLTKQHHGVRLKERNFFTLNMKGDSYFMLQKIKEVVYGYSR